MVESHSRFEISRRTMLRFTPGEWEAFVGGVRLGEFELPFLARASLEEDRLAVLLRQPFA